MGDHILGRDVRQLPSLPSPLAITYDKDYQADCSPLRCCAGGDCGAYPTLCFIGPYSYSLLLLCVFSLPPSPTSPPKLSLGRVTLTGSVVKALQVLFWVERWQYYRWAFIFFYCLPNLSGLISNAVPEVECVLTWREEVVQKCLETIKVYVQAWTSTYTWTRTFAH